MGVSYALGLTFPPNVPIVAGKLARVVVSGSAFLSCGISNVATETHGFLLYLCDPSVC